MKQCFMAIAIGVGVGYLVGKVCENYFEVSHSQAMKIAAIAGITGALMVNMHHPYDYNLDVIKTVDRVGLGVSISS